MRYARDVRGAMMDEQGLFETGHTIYVQITADEVGKTLSLADVESGVQLTIPLEPLAGVLEVVGQ